MLAHKFLDPKNDYAFKRVFGTEKNKDILVQFLNDVLDLPCPIQSVLFLKTAQDPEIAAKKQSIVDILCCDDQGAQYIVEMQVARSEGFVKRAQYYAAKVYGNQLQSGENYEKLKPVIFLAITDFIMFPNQPSYASSHTILDRETYTHELKDFYFRFIELPKFNQSIDELKTNIDKWAYFFKHAPDTDPVEWEKLTANTVFYQAYQVLDQWYWTSEELDIYEREMKNERDAKAILMAARSDGVQEGRREEKELIAKKLFSMGISQDAICKATGMLPEELEQLSNRVR